MARPSDGSAATGGHGEAARRDAGRGPGARSATGTGIRHRDPAQGSGTGIRHSDPVTWPTILTPRGSRAHPKQPPWRPSRFWP